MIWRGFIFLSILAVMGSCGAYHPDQFEVLPTEYLKADGSTSAVSFSDVDRAIFSNSCRACHTSQARPFLSDYQSYRTNLAAVESSVLSRRMPKQTRLTETQMALFRRWMEQGAPNQRAEDTTAAPGNETSPATPTPNPEVVTFAVLKTAFWNAKCVTCHSPGNTSSISDLSDKAQVSGIIRGVLGTTLISKSMPPPPAGTPRGAPNPNQLSDQEKEMLTRWIIQGMQD